MRKIPRSALFVLVPLVVLLLGAAVLLLDRSSESRPTPAVVLPEDAPADTSLQRATFAGGCFWCVESALQDIEGVVSAVSGFSGGTSPNPTYEEVSAGQTDYAESVLITYDPEKITYEQLLTVYWHYIDPTDAGGQFADRGSQYRPVIFYHNQKQQRLAQASKQELARTGPFEEPIVVKIEPFTGFYAAEEYHQDYYKKHPKRYARYYEGSGRGPFLKRVWGSAHPHPLLDEMASARASSSHASSAKMSLASTPSAASWQDFEQPSEEELRAMLTPLQYRVTQKAFTERPFQNAYYDNERPGIYVDVVSGEPLFSSKTKFHSGTGWPSFYKPLEPELVVEREDRSHGMVRTEVRSKLANSHLGHVFEWTGDPEVPTGLRYCLNSAALRFIPADKLEEAGYGEYADLFNE